MVNLVQRAHQAGTNEQQSIYPDEMLDV